METTVGKLNIKHIGFLTKGIGSLTSDLTSFETPRGIAVDRDNLLFVVDAKQKKVLRFNIDNGFNPLPSFEIGANSDPHQIAIFKEGSNEKDWRIYISDATYKKAYIFNYDGQYIRDITNEEFKQPYGIATDSVGNIYWSDIISKKILVFNKDLNKINSIELSKIVGHENQLIPFYLAYDNKEDRIYLTNNDCTTMPAIWKFDLSLGFQTKWGAYGSANAHFKAASGIAFYKGTPYVFIADDQNNRIQIFKNDGEFIGSFGTPGMKEMMFFRPVGIAFDKDSKYLFVSEMTNKRVQIFKIS